MFEIEVTYTLIMKPEKGPAIRRKGITGKTLEDPFALRDALADVFFFAVDDVVLREMEKNEAALADLQHLTVRFEDIEISHI